MRLTITTLNDQILNVDVAADLELENLKAQCEFELQIPSNEILFMWNGRPLEAPKRTLQEYGIKDGDVLLLQHLRQRSPRLPAPNLPQNPAPGDMALLDFSGISIPGAAGPVIGGQQAGPSRPSQATLEDPRVVQKLLWDSPHERALLKERNPPLSEALESGSVDRFIDVFTKQRQEKVEKEREKMRIIGMDPFNPEAQKLIAEEIRLKNVESNMESAIEYVPESFGQVVMLYIDCHVNGHAVKAFVDSGAQMTIMSQACAERCGIMRLVDMRWAGIAKGVGTQKIIGRVHLGQIQIGNDFLQSSFSILENQPMDMLLGLDMLKRHQCCIDLQNNQLVIGTTGTKTDFLPESQLPEHARVNAGPGSPQASGSQIENEDRMLAEVLQRSADEARGMQPSSRLQVQNPGNRSSASPSAAAPLGGASGGAAGGASGAVRTFPEDVIQKLVSKGYTRENVIEELTIANGNPDQALAALIVKSLQPMS